jgi:hypothetical protein
MKTLSIFLIITSLFMHVSFADISFVIENDVFAREKSDRSYTNGIKITQTTENHSLSLFQWMYTPTDIAITENQPNDRPYAGWAGIEYLNLQKRESRLFARGIQLGVIGPLAGGEFTQTNAHKIFNGRDPKGWDNQIDNKFSANLVFIYRQILFRNSLNDVILSSHNVLGNTLRQSGLGIGYRIGHNIPDDFGVFQNEPILHSIEKENYSLYLNTGISVKYVEDNFTLTGHPDNNIELENVVYTFYIGPTFEIRDWEIKYLHNFRTREFDTDNKLHIYGTLSFSRRF